MFVFTILEKIKKKRLNFRKEAQRSYKDSKL